MNILLTVGIYPPEIGGPASYVSSFGIWLNQKRLKASVATASKHSLIESSLPVYKVRKKNKFFWHINFLFMLIGKIKSFEVLYINGLFVESTLAACFGKKKYFIRIPGDQIWEKWVYKRGNNLSIDAFQNIKGSLKVRMLRKLRRIYLNKAERIIAPSYYLAKVIEGWGVEEKKIEVIFNPYLDVKSEEIKPDYITNNAFNIVTGGRLVKWKGVDSIIKAISLIKDVNLIIVGDGPEKENLKKLVKGLRMGSKVVFTGIVSRGQLKTIFEKSDCFVLNSSYEGLPHIVLEAMNGNCPVAVSKIGGNIEVIEHKRTGLLFDVDDIEAIKESILLYKDDSAFNKRIVENAKEKVKKSFNREMQFGKTFKIISGFKDNH